MKRIAIATGATALAAMLGCTTMTPQQPGTVLGAAIDRGVWVALAPDKDTILALQIATGTDAFQWRPLIPRKGFPGWSDDHASILPLLEDWRNWVPDVIKDVR